MKGTTRMTTINDLNKQTITKDFLNFNSPNARIVDQVGRDEIGPHLDYYAQNMAAKGYNIGVREILDYLYSTKKLSEDECFVTIDKCIELVKEGQMLPIIIMEVLSYAKELEETAMAMVKDNLNSDDFYITEMKKILSKRFKKEEEKHE